MVTLQFLLLTAIVFPMSHQAPAPGIFWKIAGGLLMAVGLITGMMAIQRINRFLSVMPEPVEGAKLITYGIYKYIRHPMYSSLVMASIGYATFTLDVYRSLLSILLLVLFECKTQYEESRLMQVFPDYRSYQQTTGKFFPRIFQ